MRINKSEVKLIDAKVYSKETETIFTGVIVSKDYNGKIIMEESYVEGLKHGLTKTYFPSITAVETESLFENGLKKSYKLFAYYGNLSKSLSSEHSYKMIKGKPKEHGLQKYWYRNGNLKELTSKKDGVRNGECKWWYESGFLRTKAIYKSGKLVDSSKVWYENGQLHLESSKDSCHPSEYYEKSWYENGILRSEEFFNEFNERNGICKYWYHNGELRSEETYQNDIAFGVWKKWHDNGILEEEGKYKDDYKHGSWKWYNRNGTLNGEAIFKGGKIIKGFHSDDSTNVEFKTWYENGHLLREEPLVNGEKHGVWKTWTENGVLFSEYKYEYGVCFNMKNYYKNGVLRNLFIDSNGFSKTWTENGKLKDEGFYKGGKKNGVFKTFYDNTGELFSLEEFKDDKKHGVCKSFDSQGNLISEYTYNNGKILGDEFNSKNAHLS